MPSPSREIDTPPNLRRSMAGRLATRVVKDR